MQPTASKSKSEWEKLTVIEQLLSQEEQEAAKAAAKKAKKQKQKAKKQQPKEESEDRSFLLEQRAEEQLLQQETFQQPNDVHFKEHHAQSQTQQQSQHGRDGQQQQSSQSLHSSAVETVTTSLSDLYVAELFAPARTRHAADTESIVAAASADTTPGPPQELLQSRQTETEPSTSDNFLQELFCCPLTKVTCCCPLLLPPAAMLLLTCQQTFVSVFVLCQMFALGFWLLAKSS